MKVSEFEEKLTTVTDSKLMQMLTASRRDGPAVAVKLIMAEGTRRGLKNLDPEGEAPAPEELDELMPKVEDRNRYDNASLATDRSDLSIDESAAIDSSMDSSKWLNEESNAGKVPVMIKILLIGAILAVVIFGVLKVMNHG